MKTQITLAIKLLLAAALVVAAYQYRDAMRHELNEVAVESARAGYLAKASGDSWDTAEAQLRSKFRTVD